MGDKKTKTFGIGLGLEGCFFAYFGTQSINRACWALEELVL